MKAREAKYFIITPVRNEQDYIENTILSVISQTILPQKWIIVDDGSTDATASIVIKYTKEYNFIKLLAKPDRGYKKAGYADIEAFNFGLHFVKDIYKFNFIAKLDGDLSFEDNYYEKIFERFSEQPQLGIAGGHCYQVKKGKLEMERVPDFHVRGATKIYRKKCLDEIGPFLPEVPGWDTIDELRARMKGWTTKSFKEAKVIHHRPTTSAANGILQGSLLQGEMSYFLGYHPIFMSARVIKRMTERPYIVGGFAMWWGFFLGYLKRLERFDDYELRNYLRNEQVERLLFWKSDKNR